MNQDETTTEINITENSTESDSDTIKPKVVRRKSTPLKVASIKNINFISFRNFCSTEIALGNRLTAIAGHNATGKSTILAVLGNSCELKYPEPLIKSHFRAEFSEIIKCSQDNDKNNARAVEVIFSDPNSTNTFSVPFRFGWWNYKKAKRGRLIPKHKNGEAKLSMPVLYLGLSRLVPLGECDGNCTSSKINKYLSENPGEKDWLKEKFIKIFSAKEDSITDLSSMQHQEAKKKIFFGVKTDLYDELCNSSGEDNIGQILLGVLSFKKAKTELISSGEKWNGGIFLIDEIDATIHPAAQERLLQILSEEANNLSLQIIFTTHSLSLLSYFCTKAPFKNNKTDNKVIYLTSRNGSLECLINPDFDSIKADMLLTNPAEFNYIKISLYSEDAEARWFLNGIINEKNKRALNILDIKLSCDTLVKLNNEAHDDFEKSIILLDGDYRELSSHHHNLIKLPSPQNYNPEKTIYEYLLSLPSDHPIWTKSSNPSFAKRTIELYGPNSDNYNSQREPREKFKAWFNDNLNLLDEVKILEYWVDDNKTVVNSFNNDLASKILACKSKKIKANSIL